MWNYKLLKIKKIVKEKKMKKNDVELINSENLFNNLINNDYFPVNVWLVKLFGLESTVMLGKLYDKYRYCIKHSGIKYGYFPCSVREVEDSTGLSSSRQNKALTTLIEFGIIDKWVSGLPKCRKFQINFDNYDKLETCINQIKKDYYQNRRTVELNYEKLCSELTPEKLLEKEYEKMEKNIEYYTNQFEYDLLEENE